MPKRTELTILPFSVQELFNIVIDIESYPLFLPWCIKTEIIEKHQDHLIADMSIGYQNFSGKYRSLVAFTLDNQEKAEIRVSLLEGPFKYLYNNWHFEKISDRETKVKFDIDFACKSVIFGKIVSFVFDNAFKKIMKSFENRAFSLYK